MGNKNEENQHGDVLYIYRVYLSCVNFLLHSFAVIIINVKKRNLENTSYYFSILMCVSPFSTLLMSMIISRRELCIVDVSVGGGDIGELLRLHRVLPSRCCVCNSMCHIAFNAYGRRNVSIIQVAHKQVQIKVRRNIVIELHTLPPREWECLHNSGIKKEEVSTICERVRVCGESVSDLLCKVELVIKCVSASTEHRKFDP